jgi:3-hydroxyisobutyrate dehydrogenase-like beta-hydroxyacid dehydrogenase
MDKDFGLIGELASQAKVPMPATTAAHRMAKAAHAEGLEGDFSVVIHLMRQLAGLEEDDARQFVRKGGVR